MTGVDGAVLVEVRDGIATLTLNRPGAGNAIDAALAGGFADAVHATVADPAVAVIVLQARGRSFCVGGDLSAMAASPDRAGMVANVLGRMNAAIALLRRGTRPVVAFVQGAVAGGGLGIALSADVIIAEPATRFVFAYPRVGLPPDCGVSWLLPRAIGARPAMAMALTGADLDAAEALRRGLVSEVVPADEGSARVTALAARIAAAPAAHAAARQLMLNAADVPLSSALDDEYAAMLGLVGSDEAGRRIAGFLERAR
ncbi:enoyl-CoA hydratase/isomerase family protein [Microbacterium sp. RD1]|uniref:enoyl-CoA hydratase/isomerase family protein n=1 Tax=Microbacterium sp. RD1 TaxID=3457313 RepID=UPI003FA5C8CF